MIGETPNLFHELLTIYLLKVMGIGFRF